MGYDSKSARIRCAVCAAAVAVTASVRAQEQEAKLLPQKPGKGVRFGHSVALLDQTAMVASPYPNSSGHRGAVAVFERRAAGWSHRAELVAPDVGENEHFGFSLSLDEETALVGVPNHRHGGVSSGAAFVFRKSGSSWEYEAELLAEDAKQLDYAGFSVALHGETAVVGAFGDDDLGPTAGAAFVFVRGGTAWSQQAKLTASEGDAGDRFGGAVAIDGDRILVGASHDDVTGSFSGSAYVFVREGTEWAEQAKLVPRDARGGDQFGISLAVSGEVLLIGSPGADGVLSKTGAAYVFEREGGQWSERAKLFAVNGLQDDELGRSVALEGDRALVGARFHEVDGYTFPSGSAYLFVRDGSTWTQQAQIVADDGAGEDRFARALALSGRRALCGAPWADNGSEDSGAAYVFDLGSFPGPVTYCTAKSALTCGPPSLTWSGAASASSSSGFVLSARPARQDRPGVYLYTDRGRAALPFQGGVLCVAAPLHRSPPLSSGGASACGGDFWIDWNAFAHGTLGGHPQAFLLQPGQTVDVQVWGRDAQATGSFLSDGLEYFVGD